MGKVIILKMPVDTTKDFVDSYLETKRDELKGTGATIIATAFDFEVIDTNN